MNTKKALITGAASGIGRSTAIRFAEEGYDVCINDIQSCKLKKLFKQLPKGNHLILEGSYTEKKIIAEGKDIISKHWGKLDVLINSAGVSKKSNLVEMEIGQWREIFDSMINGCLSITKLAVDFMDMGGRIIHITSIHGVRGERGFSSYSVAKSAINQFCRSMAIELAEKNILINAIAPGFVDTPFLIHNGENEIETKWFADNYINGGHLPLRRAATPKEIAGVALFLSGDDASYITGQVIIVDGGLTITF